jgi:hypothetical protein
MVLPMRLPRTKLIGLALAVVAASLFTTLGTATPAHAAATWDEAAAEAAAYAYSADMFESSTSVATYGRLGITDTASTYIESTAAGTTTWKKAFIHGQTQERWNWCGPAAATTMLTNAHVPGVSQTTLAKSTGTDGLGWTPPWNMASALNYQFDHYYGFPSSVHNWLLYGNTKSTYLSNDRLWNAVTNWIDTFGASTTIVVYSSKIWYPSAAKLTAHYLVIYGYTNNYLGHGRTYLVWDPEPSSVGGGVHHLAAIDYERVAYLGHYVIGFNNTSSP